VALDVLEAELDRGTLPSHFAYGKVYIMIIVGGLIRVQDDWVQHVWHIGDNTKVVAKAVECWFQEELGAIARDVMSQKN